MSTTQILVLTLLLLLIGGLAWHYLIRKREITKGPFPKAWKAILEKKVRFYSRLSEEEKIRFEQAIQQFLKDVQITGVEATIDDTDRLLVAASAVIPVFGFDNWRYRNLNEVLLYNASFNHDYETKLGKDRNILGMVGSGSMNRMMILSKPALRKGFEQKGSRQNVGIHEFVHLLDKSDGATDGIPELFLEEPYLIPWVKTMHREIRDIKEGDSEINVYGSTNEAEFFSVVSEFFFQQPHRLEKHHPKLFALLEKIFRQEDLS